MVARADFPIVAIGASAGGIEALEGLFRGLPERPGVGIVIVTHLSPGRESRLPQVIAHYTSLPVAVADDGMVVEPDHVYVMPADAVLGIADGVLRLQRMEPQQHERKPIDLFFASLAADRGELAVGVVLSGGDGDGTLGSKAIKERGGLTFAQVDDGHGPQHPDMPNSAISIGMVDFAVPVDAMGSQIVEFARSQHMLDSLDGTAAGGTEQGALEVARQEIYGILRNQIGHDFGGYKTQTFFRRVQRRMQITQSAKVEIYLERLRQDPQEVAALFRDLLISVTNFFRDAASFDSLATHIIPKLFEGRGAEETVRVWVPGCATGEEVFSIGILMLEHMATLGTKLGTVPRVQIFATDIDERALSVARAARYPGPLLECVTDERRQRFFVADGSSYVVAKEVRDLCIFSPHNVIRDPPFSRIDLVSCRNLLIYFGLDVQHQVIPIFHYALRPDGYLFLGNSENISQFRDLFAPVEKKHRIFRKRSDATPGVRLPLSVTRLRLGQTDHAPLPKTGPSALAFRHTVEAQVLERFTPPFVVVTRDGNIVYYSGRTGKYLEAAPGAPSRQVLAMARKGLRLDLRTALHEAVEGHRPVSRDGVVVEGADGRMQPMTLTIEPLENPDSSDPLFLVVFLEEGPPLSRAEAAGRLGLTEGNGQHLERELRDTRERLQALIEEYETALEELKSSNEELVSVNEELQSANEELEAAKEEMQSVNEELHTVNVELNNKIAALDRANSDLHNLFESSNVATLFLDPKLAIRSFTPLVARVFNILASDRGRPITDLSSHFTLPSFIQDIGRVLAGAAPVERRVEHGESGADYLVRFAPYRNGESQQIEGAVVSFVDVTELSQAEHRQRILIAELLHRTRNLLTVVQAMAVQTLGRGAPLKSFTTRLASIGRVQSLISDSRHEEVDLGELIRIELEAHAAAHGERVTIGGPPVSLNLERVQALALALHELATNAVKYGALKDGTGHLAVRWALETGEQDTETLVLHWEESGVTMPADVSRYGYGRQLIEKSLRYSLHAEAEMSFGADGLRCRIEVPLTRRGAPYRDASAGQALRPKAKPLSPMPALAGDPLRQDPA